MHPPGFCHKFAAKFNYNSFQMKHQATRFSIAAGLLLGAAYAQAQIEFTPMQFFPTGVTNEGLVVGSINQNTPEQIWNPATGEFEEIGGISSGNNVGGAARFSDDGKTICASAFNEHYMFPAFWNRMNLEMEGYTITQMVKEPLMKSSFHAVGHNTDKTSGMMFRSMNGGQTWVKWNPSGKPIVGLNSIAWLGWGTGIVAGSQGTVYRLEANGTLTPIDIHPEGNEYGVEEYTAVDFLDCAEGETISKYGVIGLRYASDDEGTGINPNAAPKEFAVWYTTDTGDTWKESTGVSGFPVYFTHYGDTFYMLTNYKTETKNLSAVWYSNDYGGTWRYLSNPKRTPNRIRFIDEKNAVMAAEGAVMFSSDGGKTWTDTFPVADVDWKDVIIIGNTVMAVGTGGNVYETSDNGTTWDKVDLGDSATPDLTAAMEHEGAPFVAGIGANFYFRNSESEKSAYGPHIYNIDDKTWTPLESSGYFSGENAGSPYGISGDGHTVVGNVPTFKQINSGSTIHSHAAAWVDGKLTDLGSMFDFMNKHTTAYEASYDGSVIVGCQDVFGPWFASVWRKNADGIYEQELLLKDSDKTIDDIEWYSITDGNGNKFIPFTGNEENAREFLGTCRAVSNNGKWIGGTGAENIAVTSPWIWSEETGLILIDEDESLDGTTSCVNEDGTMAAGWAGGGLIAWIWHKDKGSRYLTNYVSDELGGDLDDHFLCSVYDMSPNGRYLAGWCTKGQGKFGYRVDLLADMKGVEKTITQTKASVYPNPVADNLHIDVPFDDVKTTATLYDMQGRVAQRKMLAGMSNVMNVSSLAEGFYILSVEAEGARKSFKIKIRH